MVDILVTDIDDELFQAMERIAQREGKTVEDVAREALQEEARRIREETELLWQSKRNP